MSSTFALFRRQALRTPISRPTQTIRPFSSTIRFAARKDAQGKDDLKPEPNEYSKSGSDDAAARVEETAFDPDKTTPEEQHDHAAGESTEGSNPLNVSPANHEVSKASVGTEGNGGGSDGSSAQTGEGNSDRARSSGGGSPKKGGSGQKYSS